VKLTGSFAESGTTGPGGPLELGLPGQAEPGHRRPILVAGLALASLATAASVTTVAATASTATKATAATAVPTTSACSPSEASSVAAVAPLAASLGDHVGKRLLFRLGQAADLNAD
jgi:hypothetical protein